MREGTDRNAQCPKCDKKFKHCSGHWLRWIILSIAVLIVLCLIILFITDDQSNSKANAIPSKPNQSTFIVKPGEKTFDLEKIKQVYLLWNEWLKAVHHVVEEADNDSTANEIYKFILTHSVLGYPYEQGGRLVSVPENKDCWFAFIPLPDYAKDFLVLKHVFSISAAGCFMFGANILLIQENPPVSKIWRGLIVLHEGYHARASLIDSPDWSNHRILCEHEVSTHNFQNKLMEKIGGDLYQQCLQREFENIKEKSVIKNGALRGFVKMLNYDSRLDEAFGPALSNDEMNTRQTHLWIAAMFKFLDEPEQKTKIINTKAEFLYSLYIKGGIIQRK